MPIKRDGSTNKQQAAELTVRANRVKRECIQQRVCTRVCVPGTRLLLLRSCSPGRRRDPFDRGRPWWSARSFIRDCLLVEYPVHN